MFLNLFLCAFLVPSVDALFAGGLWGADGGIAVEDVGGRVLLGLVRGGYVWSVPMGVACTVLSDSMPIGMAGTVFLDSLSIAVVGSVFLGSLPIGLANTVFPGCVPIDVACTALLGTSASTH